MSAEDHGKADTYVHYRCRCESCTKAHRVWVAAARARRANQAPPADSHGKRSTYNNWKCRCEPCSTANSLGMRQYRKTGSHLPVPESTEEAS